MLRRPRSGAIHTSVRAERAAPSFAEQRLWAELRKFRAEGYPFRRQAPIGPYIADFVCFSARLIVEADGGIHALTAERDAVRDAWLTQQGFRVLRFDNATIIQDTETVGDAVRQKIKI